MPPDLKNPYYAQATCSGFGELPERMRDVNISHAPLPTPFSSSTSLQGAKSRKWIARNFTGAYVVSAAKIAFQIFVDLFWLFFSCAASVL